MLYIIKSYGKVISPKRIIQRGEKRMDNLKGISISLLCKIGKFGVGKSLVFGMYDFEVPKKLMECKRQKTDNGMKELENNKRVKN